MPLRVGLPSLQQAVLSEKVRLSLAAVALGWPVEFLEGTMSAVMQTKRRRSIAAVFGVAMVVAVLSACAADVPAPAPDVQKHVTVWGADLAWPESSPEVVDSVGYGTWVHHINNHPMYGGCMLSDSDDDGWTESYTRINASTIRMRLTLHWTEIRNDGTGNFECAPNEDLFGDLQDAAGNLVTPYWIQLISHS